MPYCWGGVIHGPHACTCYPPKKKKPKPEEINLMDIINMLHSAFRDVQHFEFGDDFVRVFDAETKKHYEIKISEYQPKDKSQTCAETQRKGLSEIKKSNSTRQKEKKKTWESILKERK